MQTKIFVLELLNEIKAYKKAPIGALYNYIVIISYELFFLQSEEQLSQSYLQRQLMQ